MAWRNIVRKSTQLKILDKVKELTYDINPRIYIGILFLITYISLRPNEIRLYSDFPTAEYTKYQAGYAFYPDFKCAESCQFLYNISVCKGFIMKPAEKSTCAPTSSMVALSRAG